MSLHGLQKAAFDEERHKTLKKKKKTHEEAAQ